MATTVIPAIRSNGWRPGSFTIDATTPVVACCPELEGVAKRFVADLEIDTGLELSAVARRDGDQSTEREIRIELSSSGLADLRMPGGVRADGRNGADADERHGIHIRPEGVRIWGPTVEAVHRGLTSLRQLASAHVEDGAAELPAMYARDVPRFSWRGLSLDVSRTFHDVETVRRVIDMCALYKLNVLHLHLTDDQGWRLEVPGWPALTEVGGRGAVGDRSGGFYSAADTALLVAYAAERFVTIVPEIDMPGHTGAVFASYPELAPSSEAVENSPIPIGTLDPQRELTWDFVSAVIDAAIAQFPQSAYVHIGGDEAFGMADEAHAEFVNRTVRLVRERGRRVTGWQEIARADVGPDELVQYWIEPAEMAAMMDSPVVAAMIPPEMLPLFQETFAKAVHDVPTALAKGASVIVSPTTRLYFDRPHGTESLDAEQEALRPRLGLPVYPPTTLRTGVEWEPLDELPEAASEDRLAGVEAAIWCETITSREDLELLLLPRLPGAAEKAWGAPGPTDWDNYARRLARQTSAWDRRGWSWFRSAEIEWPARVTVGAS